MQNPRFFFGDFFEKSMELLKLVRQKGLDIFCRGICKSVAKWKNITEVPVTMVSNENSQRRLETSVKNNITNPTENVKQKQLEIINESNPAPNTYRTWVRSIDDIRKESKNTYRYGLPESGFEHPNRCGCIVCHSRKNGAKNQPPRGLDNSVPLGGFWFWLSDWHWIKIT